MHRVFNFSSGPACLPESVLEKAKKEFMSYQSYGMSVMEMSHRSKMYQDIFDETKSLFIELMAIPKNYKVLFLQGGASLQFSMIPMNLLTNTKKCDYVNTGLFASKAIQEAKKYGDVNVCASSENKNFSYIPEISENTFRNDSDYAHITLNNTAFGTKFKKIPKTGIPLVSDISSCILSENIDINSFGLLYAGAQKNIGPAGFAIVIIKEDLLRNPIDMTPAMLDYRVHSSANSMYNTPPTYSIYIAGLVFKWLKDLGGVSAIEQINIEKANILYDFIDNSNIFTGTANREDRSIMNVTFLLPTETANAKFVKEAESAGLLNLSGHRDAGGMRASIYNAMPIEGVKKLVEFMKKFEIENHSER